MEISLPIGLEAVREYVVEREHLAAFLGSGGVDVLSTPSMINWMENTARLEIDKHLPEGYTTVGYRVDVYHLNPAPLGAKITVRAKLVKQEGKKLVLEVSAYWGDTKIGEGIHERYIINIKRFLEKVKEKLELQ
ncbi:MAG: thioesterase family protein [Candidatus Njordarchaeia archaeon]